MSATEELNNKMKQFTENAMAFTLDGGINAYEFKDEDDVPDEVPDLKQLMGAPRALKAGVMGCYETRSESRNSK